MKDMPVVDEQASREPYTKFDTQVITYDLDQIYGKHYMMENKSNENKNAAMPFGTGAMHMGGR